MAAAGLKCVLPSQIPGQVAGKGWPGLLLPHVSSSCAVTMQRQKQMSKIFSCKQGKNMKIFYSSKNIQKLNKKHRSVVLKRFKTAAFFTVHFYKHIVPVVLQCQSVNATGKQNNALEL